MRQIKTCISAFVIAAVFSLCIASASHASGVMPLWENTKTVQTILSFSDDQAVCSVYISGKDGTSRMTGTLTLKDQTTGKPVDTWVFETKNSIYSMTKYADAIKGHTYVLSFTGKVYNASNVGEAVSGSVTKTY